MEASPVLDFSALLSTPSLSGGAEIDAPQLTPEFLSEFLGHDGTARGEAGGTSFADILLRLQSYASGNTQTEINTPLPTLSQEIIYDKFLASQAWPEEIQHKILTLLADSPELSGNVQLNSELLAKLASVHPLVKEAVEQNLTNQAPLAQITIPSSEQMLTSEALRFETNSTSTSPGFQKVIPPEMLKQDQPVPLMTPVKESKHVNVEVAKLMAEGVSENTVDNQKTALSQVIKREVIEQPEQLLMELSRRQQTAAGEAQTSFSSQARDLFAEKGTATSHSNAVIESNIVTQSVDKPSEKMFQQMPMEMKLRDFQNFPKAMGERLAWMVNKEQRIAQIRLDPPELGRLQVALSVDGDQVSVQFHASGNAVKDLILQQVERLRTALASNDLNLVNVNVSTGSDSHSGSKYQLNHSQSSVSPALVDDNPSESETLEVAQTGVSGFGILDTFA